MSRSRMCEALRQDRITRQRVRYALIRHRRTHKGRAGHRFVIDKTKPGRICKKCGKGY